MSARYMSKDQKMTNTKELEARINAYQCQLEEFKSELARLKAKPAPKQRFFKDQPVLVRDRSDGEWHKRYFANPGEAFDDGKTSRTSSHLTLWNQIKPDPDAPSLLNWQEWHGGEQPVPDDTLVIVVSENDYIEVSAAKSFHWSWTDTCQDIVLYAAISLPEWEDGK